MVHYMLTNWEDAVTLNMGDGGLRMAMGRFSRGLRTISFTHQRADFGPIEQNGLRESLKKRNGLADGPSIY